MILIMYMLFFFKNLYKKMEKKVRNGLKNGSIFTQEARVTCWQPYLENDFLVSFSHFDL